MGGEMSGQADSDCRKPTILVVDDDDIMLSLMVDLLTYEGKNPIPADNCALGLEIFSKRSRDIDLVIFDYQVPGCSVKELIDQFRTIDPGVRVVLATGMGREKVKDVLAHESVVGYLQKPFDVHELSQAVRKALTK
jgi:DNA-binding NtrC family response regulator